MPTFLTSDEIADSDIVDAELHAGARLRYIQRRIQAEEGLRLTIDNVAYVLRLNDEYERLHGFT